MWHVRERRAHYGRILDRHRGTLCHERQDGMSGVAEQRDPLARERAHGEVVQRP